LRPGPRRAAGRAQPGARRSIGTRPCERVRRMTFSEQLALTLVDKLAIGGILVIGGWWLNRLLQVFKSQQDLKNELAKSRDARHIEFLDKQLSQFYYPIYIRLHIDDAVWKRILDKRGGDEDLRRRLAAAMEKNTLLPNHEEIVRVMQSNIHLAESDGAAFEAMLRYIRHVAVYKAMREAGCHDRDPASVGEPWPEDLLPMIVKTTGVLQDRYLKLVASATKRG
jgi:hypothetical protein